MKRTAAGESRYAQQLRSAHPRSGSRAHQQAHAFTAAHAAAATAAAAAAAILHSQSSSSGPPATSHSVRHDEDESNDPKRKKTKRAADAPACTPATVVTPMSDADGGAGTGRSSTDEQLSSASSAPLVAAAGMDWAPTAVTAPEPAFTAAGTHSAAAGAAMPIGRRLLAPRRYATRRSPGQPFLTQLATDEVRMIMQCLDRLSLCYLARCCRRMFADADSPIAWKTQPLLDALRRDDERSEAKRRRMCPPSLLAHAPKHATIVDIANELSMLVTIPRLVSLALFDAVPFSPQQMQLLRESACIDTVTRLDLVHRGEFSDPSLMDLLHTFSTVTDLTVKGAERPLLPADPGSALNDATCRLRRLHVFDGVFAATSQVPSKFILSILHCSGLTYLRISTPTITGLAFVDFFANLAMANLQVLRLDELQPPPLLVDYRPAFAALRLLRSFMVTLPYGRPADFDDSYDRFFTSVIAAPALEYLGIRDQDACSTSVPSRPVLAQLLVDSPILHISLVNALCVSDAARAALLALNHPRLNVRIDAGWSSDNQHPFLSNEGFLHSWPDHGSSAPRS